MRFVVILGLVLMLSHVRASAAQTPSGDLSVTLAPSQVGGGQATVPVTPSGTIVDGPMAAVGAPRPLRGAEVTDLKFGIRAWKEGDRVRVVLFAMLNDPRAPGGRTTTPIATASLTLGQSVEFAETEKWGASRVFVQVVPRHAG